MRISVIAAVASNGAIGLRNDLPWRMPADLKRFRELTIGHTVLLGRKTFESIGRPLPRRRSIVITSQRSLAWPEGVVVAHDFDSAIKLADCSELFVAGGAEVYRQALPIADRLLITRLSRAYPGDTFFPEIDAKDWLLTCYEPLLTENEPQSDCVFATYSRRIGNEACR